MAQQNSPGGGGSLPLARRDRMLLAAIAALLGLLLLWLRGGLHPEAPLERLARQSLDLPVALTNGRPTLVEFYADWCEACRAMAPAMETLERRHGDSLDVVLLNVDNPRWQPEVERFEVNGIPQLELFDADGGPVGRSLGARTGSELEALVEALINKQPLPALAGVGAISRLGDQDLPASGTLAPTAASPAGPRSHG
ncbi:MAG: thioredoxin domain-containing protein [Prochlorococcaceae cyanobacterium]